MPLGSYPNAQAADRPLLTLSANRDEFFRRETEPLHEWADAPGLLAGRDLSGGGTWLGVTRDGRFAALTNYRAPDESPAAKTAESDAMSRDLLKRGFKFVGSTICYAFMQATGMVNDHSTDCFRHAELCGPKAKRPAPMVTARTQNYLRANKHR